MASFIIFWETEADVFFLSATSEISSEIESIDKTVDQLSKYTEMIVGKLVNLGFDILTAIIIFIVGKFVIRMIRKLVKNIFTRSGTDIGVSRICNCINYYLRTNRNRNYITHYAARYCRIIDRTGAAGLSFQLCRRDSYFDKQTF